MNLTSIRELIRQFLSGTKTQAGKKIFDQWYHSFDDQSSKLDELSEKEKENLKAQLYNRIEVSINAEPPQLQPGYHHSLFTRRNLFFRVAAVFMLVSLLTFPVLYYAGVLSDEKANDVIAYTTAENPRGQTSQITLADGTNVWLGAESRLRYPRQFTDSLREVYLSGEAFFDVKRKETTPFVVHSSVITTRVLGTSFNIRAYDEDRNIQVTVATGKVSVEKNTPQGDAAGYMKRHPLALLTPDKQIVYEHSTGKSQINQVNASRITGWKDGRLTFEEQAFEDIAREFERWYGVNFRFEHITLKNQQFTFSFTDMPLTYALNMMQNTSNFTYKFKQDTVWITK